ncbi:MAG: MarR family transcriptional regulator [Solirubrobacterales bacterium]
MHATETAPSKAGEALANELRIGIGLLLRRLRQVPVEDELTLPEASALARLDRYGPATSSELAKREQISPQSMGATTAALEARGLVRRAADPEDGRRQILSPTEAGLATLRGRRNARTRRLAAALDAEFSAAELERLRAAAPLVERLAQSI